MHITEAIGTGTLPSDNTVIGIDIGSRQAKAVLFDRQQFYTALIPTGFVMKETAEKLIESLLSQAGIERSDIKYIVCTGYGRVALHFDDIPYTVVTEIACHGMGAHYIGDDIHTIIDIGGQDSKAIKIDPKTGKVLNFAMNDKCAAGTGRFLERIAQVLGQDVKKIGAISLESKNPAPISAQCIVFAESEVVSGRAKGEQVADLAAGINQSVATRVSALINSVGIEKNVFFTGGVSNNVGIRKAFEDLLGFPFAQSRIDTVYAGAFGAAVFASENSQRAAYRAGEEENEFHLNLTSLRTEVDNYKELIATGKTGKKKTVGYTCAYVPVELLSAANVAHFRIVHAGSPDEVMAGESITQSVFCDITKSILGSFITENALVKTIDHVYSFYTCDCMRNTIEAIDTGYVPATLYNVPRVRDKEESVKYFRTEIESFKKDLEKLTGEKIEDETIRINIALYNQAKKLIREISAFRKLGTPLLTGSEFKEIALSYYYLPVERLLFELRKILAQLQDAPKSDKKSSRPRIILCGGVAADGDGKVLDILEELGADVVADDNCTGLRPALVDVPETGDWIDDLARGYLGKAPCARMKPVDQLVGNTVKLAKEYGAEGVVFYFLKFCPCYSMVVRNYMDAFEPLGIPVLTIASDYAKGDEGQIKIRTEAFLEMLRGKEN